MQLMDATTGKPGDMIFRTSVGEALYPHLDAPDTKFGQDRYKVGLILAADDVRAVEDALTSVYRSAFPDEADAPKMPFKIDRDGQPYIVAKSTFQPKLLDVARKPIEARIRTGDKIRLTGRVRPFRTALSKGVALYLSSVELTEPREPAPSLDDDVLAGCPF